LVVAAALVGESLECLAFVYRTEEVESDRRVQITRVLDTAVPLVVSPCRQGESCDNPVRQG
jgi:hypothetical protein